MEPAGVGFNWYMPFRGKELLYHPLGHSPFMSILLREFITCKNEGIGLRLLTILVASSIVVMPGATLVASLLLGLSRRSSPARNR